MAWGSTSGVIQPSAQTDFLMGVASGKRPAGKRCAQQGLPQRTGSMYRSHSTPTMSGSMGSWREADLLLSAAKSLKYQEEQFDLAASNKTIHPGSVLPASFHPAPYMRRVGDEHAARCIVPSVNLTDCKTGVLVPTITSSQKADADDSHSRPSSSSSSCAQRPGTAPTAARSAAEMARTNSRGRPLAGSPSGLYKREARQRDRAGCTPGFDVTKHHWYHPLGQAEMNRLGQSSARIGFPSVYA
mmetsp:Transcript_1881/g.3982  ORF Transcript_1881/g.3982 Transcript_1881/m.3982 type:complete len:243 (-) Transcript_1881:14-742(-)